jgi:hypothetical protein
VLASLVLSRSSRPRPRAAVAPGCQRYEVNCPNSVVCTITKDVKSVKTTANPVLGPIALVDTSYNGCPKRSERS